MTHPIKDLLDKLGVDTEVLHLGCNVEQNIARLRSQISEVPAKDSPEDKTVKFTLDFIRSAAKTMVKDARRKELELEMQLLEKPDEVDLESEEHRHVALHLEEEQLQAEAMKRQGEAILRFCTIIENRYGTNVH